MDYPPTSQHTRERQSPEAFTKTLFIREHSIREHSILVSVSAYHNQMKTLLHRVQTVLEACDPRLLDAVNHIVLPFAPRERDRHTGRSVAASAARYQTSTGTITILGTDHQADNYRCFTPEIFEHELAHLAGFRGGLPRSLAATWPQARYADQSLQASLPDLDPYSQQHAIGPITRRFLIVAPWLTDHVASSPIHQKRECEDWAESVCMHLRCERHGAVWQETGQQLIFKQRYPHRHRLLTDWFAGRA